jgi:hypothetical protein
MTDEGFISAQLESSQVTSDKITLNFVDDKGNVRSVLLYMLSEILS